MFVLAAALAVSYLQHIVPILRDNCLACHSSETKQGGLVMDSYESLMKGGKNGTVILAGKAGESRLVLMLRGKVRPQMPLGATLPSALVETIVRWIDAGAPGPTPGETTPSTAVRIPDIQPRKSINPLVASLAFSPDGRLLAAGRYREVQLLDPTTQRVVGTLTGHADVVRALALSPDGKLLAAAGGEPAQSGEVIVWSLETRERLAHIHGHSDAIYAVAFSHDSSRLATASYDRLIRLWDPASGKEIATLKDHIDSVFALAFSPDGKRLASGAADRTVKLWDAATGQRLFTLSESQDAVLSLAFHPSGRQIAAGCADKFLRTWQLADKGGTLLHSMAGHEDAILRLAYSPDGKRLVTSSADRTIRVWNAQTLEEIQVIGPQPDWVSALTFSPDGKRLAAGRFDGSITILQP